MEGLIGGAGIPPCVLHSQGGWDGFKANEAEEQAEEHLRWEKVRMPSVGDPKPTVPVCRGNFSTPQRSTREQAKVADPVIQFHVETRTQIHSQLLDVGVSVLAVKRTNLASSAMLTRTWFSCFRLRGSASNFVHHLTAVRGSILHRPGHVHLLAPIRCCILGCSAAPLYCTAFASVAAVVQFCVISRHRISSVLSVGTE